MTDEPMNVAAEPRSGDAEDPAASVRKFQKELSAGTVSLVLLALLDRTTEPLYGYQIAKELEAASNGGLRCIPNPQPFSPGGNYVTYDVASEAITQFAEASRSAAVLLDHRRRPAGPGGLERCVDVNARFRQCGIGGTPWLATLRRT